MLGGLAALVLDDGGALRLAAGDPRALLGDERLGGVLVLGGEGALTVPRGQVRLHKKARAAGGAGCTTSGGAHDAGSTS